MVAAAQQGKGNWSYAYDAAGNLTEQLDANGRRLCFTYDGLYQLTQAWYGADATTPGSISSYDDRQTYSLDTLGNRLEVSFDDNITTTVQPYGQHDNSQLSNGMNRYDVVDDNPLSYDLRGNTLADGLTTNSYGYDVLNRQISLTNGDDSAEYIYDAMGRRIAKVVTTTAGVTTTHFIYDKQFRVIEERSSQSVWQARYTYGSGIDEVLLMERNSTSYYLHRDALGSITEVTNSSGNLVERYEYDVYSQPEFYDGSYSAITESAIGNPYLFTGRRYDSESGNYYYRARIYSPVLGRFLSMDPLGYEAGDANLYRYVFNNPANFTDPTGEIPLLATALIGGLLNLTADYLITTYLEDEVYTWSRAGIAFGTGALAGLTGAGIGAVAGRVTSGIIAWGIRIGLNAGSNATINYIQRYLNKECTLAEDVLTDLLFGSVAGGLDGVFERIVTSARPHIIPVKIIKNTRFGIINSGKWAGRQGFRLFREEIPEAVRHWEATMPGLALGLSNSSIVSLLTTAVTEAADKIQEWINEEDFY